MPFENLNPFQIINLVQRSGASCLDVPPPDALPAGPFAAPGSYDAYVALMQRCWARRPEDRPGFEEVSQLWPPPCTPRSSGARFAPVRWRSSPSRVPTGPAAPAACLTPTCPRGLLHLALPFPLR